MMRIRCDRSAFLIVSFLMSVCAFPMGRAEAMPFLDRTREAVRQQAGVRAEVVDELNADSAAGKVAAQLRLQERFCAAFADTAGTLARRLGDIESKIAGRRDDLGERWENRWENRDEELGKIRTEQDARREEWYEKLDGGSLTEGQSVALKAFRDTVDAAVDKRRDAVDAAKDSFRVSVETLSESRQSALDVASDEFRVSVEAAVSVARESCEDGDDAKTVRKTFQASLNAARKELRDDRKSTGDTGTEIAALARIRNEAIREAMSTFHDELETAKTTLKDSFPEPIISEGE